MSNPTVLAALIHEVRCEAEVRKSRFLAIAAPVESPEAAQAFLDRVADRQATHNCWAYRMGQLYRFNDDGEPAGTAGRPILLAIDGQGLDNAAVMVTRWFGGIKLGAGGLVRAYGGTAAELLRTAPRQPRVIWKRITIDVAFAFEAALRGAVGLVGGEITHLDYGTAGITMMVRVPATAAAAFTTHVVNLSRGRATVKAI